MSRIISRGRVFACIVFLLTAAGTLGAARMKAPDLELIAHWINGVYDVAPGKDATTTDGHVLIIERVSSPMISWHVFYAEERDPDGTPIARQLLSFEIAKDKKSIVERSYSFKEPRRWERGLEHPDIFKSIISDDLTVASGCEIFWFHDKDGFTGRTSAHACMLRVRATGTTMQIELRAKLTPGEFIYGDRTFRKRATSTQ